MQNDALQNNSLISEIDLSRVFLDRPGIYKPTSSLLAYLLDVLQGDEQMLTVRMSAILAALCVTTLVITLWAQTPKPPYDLDAILKERAIAYQAWLAAHPGNQEAQIADLKAKTAALVKQTGAAGLPANRSKDSKPIVWNVDGAIKEIWDAADVPVLAVIPAGAFVMGGANDPNRDREPPPVNRTNATPPTANAAAAPLAVPNDPRHPVTIAYPFALGKYPVTRAEFAHFVVDTGYQTNGACSVRKGDHWEIDATKEWRDPGFEQTPDMPVVCVSWNDAIAYAAWVSGKTGKKYRLPSAAEYEYAAAGGTSGTTYWFGSKSDHDYMNYGSDDLCAGGACTPLIKGNDKWAFTSPVGAFKANPFGLHDMNGNVRQWVADCNSKYPVGSPVDGKPDTADCTKRRQRSGSWNSIPAHSFPNGDHTESPEYRSSSLSFRLARSL